MDNVTDASVTIQNNFPLFIINPVNIPDHVTDPQLDTVSDEPFIYLFDIGFEVFPRLKQIRSNGCCYVTKDVLLSMIVILSVGLFTGCYFIIYL